MIVDTEIILDDEPTTLRKYFKRILEALFREGDSFSGKRPLGNSGWEFDVAIALIQAELLEGTVLIDDSGYVEDCEFEWADFHEVIAEALEEL